MYFFFIFYLFSPLATINETDDCCAKIKVDSQGISKTTHFWALGIFDKSDKLTEPAYKQSKSSDSSDQYYLEGNEDEGWKVKYSEFITFSL